MRKWKTQIGSRRRKVGWPIFQVLNARASFTFPAFLGFPLLPSVTGSIQHVSLYVHVSLANFCNAKGLILGIDLGLDLN